jgi:hypothetical protein
VRKDVKIKSREQDKLFGLSIHATNANAYVWSYLNDVATNRQGLSRVLRIVAEPAVRRRIEHADSDIDVGTNSKPFNDVAA